MNEIQDLTCVSSIGGYRKSREEELQDSLFPMDSSGYFDRNLIKTTIEESIEISLKSNGFPILDEIVDWIRDDNDTIFYELACIEVDDNYDCKSLSEDYINDLIDDAMDYIRSGYYEILSHNSRFYLDDLGSIEEYVLDEIKTRGDCVKIFDEDMYYPQIVTDSRSAPPIITMFSKEDMGGVYYGDCQQILLRSLLVDNLLKSGKAVCIYDFDNEEQILLE